MEILGKEISEQDSQRDLGIGNREDNRKGDINRMWSVTPNLVAKSRNLRAETLWVR